MAEQTHVVLQAAKVTVVLETNVRRLWMTCQCLDSVADLLAQMATMSKK
jgi:hypothetical protein